MENVKDRDGIMNRVQKIGVDILQEITAVMDKHGLTYYVAAGTLIGAVRHNGFIPWDDDIDIVLPRQQYELFRTEYYKELPKHLQKLDYDDCEPNNFLFTKIHNINTTYVGDYCKNYPEWYTGVFVDIFPLDGLPSDETKRRRHLNKIYTLMKLNNVRRQGNVITEKTNPILRIVKPFLGSLLKLVFMYNHFSDKIQKLCESVPYETSEFVFPTGGAFDRMMMDRLVFKKCFYDKPTKMEFENMTVNVPSGYDAMLTQQYGDYMKLPPQDQQIPHSVEICELDVPVAYYKKQ